MSLDLEHVRSICSRVAASYGLVVADIEYVRGAGKGGRILRIFLDTPWKPGDPVYQPQHAKVEVGVEDGEPVVATQCGVTIEHCANVSREVGTILDVEKVMLGDDY